jgi:DNA-binding CsgD family transcriptional regulator
MDSGLVAQGLRVSELLLESVAEPSRLKPALQVMTAMINADIGLLATGLRSSGCLRSLISTAQETRATEVEELHFPSFARYRRLGLMQPAGKFYREREIARLRDPSAPGINPTRRPHSGAYCLAHVDTGEDRVCYVGFARSDTAKPFARHRLQATENLLPLVRAACVSNRQFGSFKAVSRAVMNRYERYHVGCILVDESALVLYRNECARELLEQSDGLRITANGRLAACSEAETAALNAAIGEHLAGDLPDSHFASDLLKVSRPNRREALSLAISPYRGGAHSLHDRLHGGHAVIMVFNPHRPPVQRGSVVSQVLDLSATESHIACAIAAGESLEAIALASNRSVEAIRSQLKRIFRKTGTSRQTELVKLVLSGPAAMVQ